MKKLKVLKKGLTLFLVLFLCTENFAAIVSDNDGSAFITKAEFDSLKNNFQSQIDQYNTSIDSKIDGAIAAYLAGIRVSKTTELTNNLSKLQNSYDVYWCNQTGGLVTTKVNYGSSYEIQMGSRGASLIHTDARQAQAVSTVEGDFVKYPIITKSTEGSDVYEISYWEERKPWISYCGFFMGSGNNVSAFLSWSINGIFSTIGFNPNTNDIFKRQDQWWRLEGVSEPTRANGSWAMSIWGTYSTKVQNKDTRSIFIYPNAGNTYCWNESDKTKSSGQDGGVTIPDLKNNGSWANDSVNPKPATAYSGNLTLTGYTRQSTANFPWCHTQYQYKNLYDSRISTITGVKFPIRAGLLVSDGVGPGTLKIKALGTAAGTLQITIMNADNTSQLKYVTDTVNMSEKTISVDLKNLEGKQKFNVWIKYLPSVKAELFIESVMFESELT